jgi:hypothetical protein
MAIHERASVKGRVIGLAVVISILVSSGLLVLLPEPLPEAAEVVKSFTVVTGGTGIVMGTGSASLLPFRTGDATVDTLKSILITTELSGEVIEREKPVNEYALGMQIGEDVVYNFKFSNKEFFDVYLYFSDAQPQTGTIPTYMWRGWVPAGETLILLVPLNTYYARVYAIDNRSFDFTKVDGLGTRVIFDMDAPGAITVTSFVAHVTLQTFILPAFENFRVVDNEWRLTWIYTLMVGDMPVGEQGIRITPEQVGTILANPRLILVNSSLRTLNVDNVRIFVTYAAR